MPVVDELITKFTAQDNISGPSKQMSGALGSFGTQAGAVTGTVGALSAAVIAFGATALASGAVALINLGKSATEANAKMRSLERGLMAVTGGAGETAEQMKRLEQIALLPGLDLRNVVQSFTDLKSSGVGVSTAERAIKSFGNALATVGRGPADLAGVLYGVRQLATSDTILAEDLNIIKERVPQVTKALRELYGTSRPEDIVKMGVDPDTLLAALIAKMEELPQATGDIEEAWINLGDQWTKVLSKMGGPINDVLIPILERASNFLAYIADSGIAERIGTQWAKLFNGDAIGDGIIGFIAVVAAGLKNLPTLISDVAEQFKSAMLAMLRAGDAVINLLNRIPGLKLPSMEQAAKAALAAGMGSSILGPAGAKFAVNTMEDAKKLTQGFGSLITSGPEPAEEDEPGAGKLGGKATGILERIEQNTRPLLDFRQMILGGGELGGMGVTAAEITGLKKGSRSGRAGRIEAVIADVARVIMEEMSQTASETTRNQRRMGVLPT